MRKEILSMVLLLALGVTACDDGKIYGENNYETTKGSTLKMSSHISGIDKWPEGYSVVVAGFGENDYAIISKVIPAPGADGEAVDVILSGITAEVTQVELCVINRLRKRVATFYKGEFNAQTDTVYMDAGTINANMFDCIQTNVLDAYCTACHGASNTAAAGLHLTSGSSYRALVGIPAKKSPDKTLLVSPGDPGDSFLHLVLNTDLSHDWRMDHIDMITSPDLLTLIDSWIEGGAKE